MNEPLSQSAHCPLCERVVGHDRLLLYNFRVCRECRDDLSNRRRAAFFIDVVCFWMLLLIVTESLLGRNSDTVRSLLATLALIALFGFKDGFGGRSPGKWLFGLRAVHRKTHGPIGLVTSFRRNLPIMGLDIVHFAILELPTNYQSLDLIVLPLIVKVGFYLYLDYQASRGPRWGDGLAGTKVVLVSLAYRPPFDLRGAHCLKCAYDLTGNVSGVCPECGTSVTAISRIKWHVKQDQNNH